MSKPFYFRSFEVVQEVNAMKVGTDSVLLGACSNVQNVSTVLDVGAGTGVVALMIAQRCDALVDAVEIDGDNSNECNGNFDRSPWSDRLRCFHSSFQQFLPDKKYDLIVSNPPYFNNSFPSENSKRNQARQQHSLGMDEFIRHCAYCLAEPGLLSVILPSESAAYFTELAIAEGLNCCRVVRVHGRAGKGDKRRILEFGRKYSTLSEETIVIEQGERHDYTNQYLDLMRDFLFLE